MKSLEQLDNAARKYAQVLQSLNAAIDRDEWGIDELDVKVEEAVEQLLIAAITHASSLGITNCPVRLRGPSQDKSEWLERYSVRLGVCYEVMVKLPIGLDPAEAFAKKKLGVPIPYNSRCRPIKRLIDLHSWIHLQR